MNDVIPVRHLATADVALMTEWAAAEGWNPGLHDAGTFYAADPGGFLASLADDEPAAVVSLVRYGEGMAFLGLYICRPDLRGQGYGWRAWQAAMELAGDRTIGLDGVSEQQPNYVRSGFELAWQNARYTGQGGGAMPSGLVPLDRVPLASLVAFDREIGGVDRERYLRAWVNQPDAAGFACLDGDGQLRGWGLVRPCHEGWKIGPLLANDAETGICLLDGLRAVVGNDEISLDLPVPNQVAVEAARVRGMTPSFFTARMYRGAPPVVDLTRLWGVASFELG